MSIAAFVDPLETRTFFSAGSGPGCTNPPRAEVPTSSMMAKPTDLAASAEGTKVTLTWKDNSTNETGFTVFRVSCGRLTQVGTAPANATTFVDNAAPVGNDFYVVRAVGDTTKSEVSNVVSVKVAPTAQPKKPDCRETKPTNKCDRRDPPRRPDDRGRCNHGRPNPNDPGAKLSAPTAVNAQAASATSMKLTWSGDTGASVGYLVERSPDGADNWVAIGGTQAGVRTFTDSGLSAGTTYYYRVTSLGANNAQAASAAVSGTTNAA